VSTLTPHKAQPTRRSLVPSVSGVPISGLDQPLPFPFLCRRSSVSIYTNRTDNIISYRWSSLSNSTLRGGDKGFMTYGVGEGTIPSTGHVEMSTTTIGNTSYPSWSWIVDTPEYFLNQTAAQGLALLVNQSGSGDTFTVTVMTSARCGASYGTPGQVAGSGIVPAAFHGSLLSLPSGNPSSVYWPPLASGVYYTNLTQSQCINPADFYSVNASGLEYGVTVNTSQVPFFIKDDFASIAPYINASSLANSGPCWNTEVTVDSLTSDEYSLFLRFYRIYKIDGSSNYYPDSPRSLMITPSTQGVFCFNDVHPALYSSISIVLAVHANLTEGDRTINMRLKLTQPHEQVSDGSGNIVPCKPFSAPLVSAPDY
jgi:hypothetical protein